MRKEVYDWESKAEGELGMWDRTNIFHFSFRD